MGPTLARPLPAPLKSWGSSLSLSPKFWPECRIPGTSGTRGNPNNPKSWGSCSCNRSQEHRDSHGRCGAYRGLYGSHESHRTHRSSGRCRSTSSRKSRGDAGTQCNDSRGRTYNIQNDKSCCQLMASLEVIGQGKVPKPRKGAALQWGIQRRDS